MTGGALMIHEKKRRGSTIFNYLEARNTERKRYFFL